MARYLQKRKRSAGPFRRTHKRRRFVRRRRVSRAKTFHQGGARVTNNVWGSRPLTRRKIRAFKRNLWNVSSIMQKFRAGGVGNATMYTPTAAALNMMKYQSWVPTYHPTNLTDSSNWVDDMGDRAITLAGNNVIIRGGTFHMSINHEVDTEDIEFDIYLCKIKGTSVVPYITAADANRCTSPNIGNDLSNDIKVLRNWRGKIKSQEGFSLDWKIPLMKVDKARHDALKDVYFFTVGIGATYSSSGDDQVRIILSSTAYCCADIITAT